MPDVAQLGLRARFVDGSHAHEHLLDLRERFHTKIAMHADDLDLVNTPTVEKVMENCRYHSPILNLVFLIINGKLNKIVKKTLDDFESFKPDIILEDGFDLTPYGFSAKVIHIPGHTKGSIGILTEDGSLLAGDIFANVKKPAIAPNACSFQTLKSSVNKIKAMPVKTIYPGHGSPFDAAELSGIL
jgi:glyoxylase-like metal-dependent hydrolase (beta-lactamase superfamily II)